MPLPGIGGRPGPQTFSPAAVPGCRTMARGAFAAHAWLELDGGARLGYSGGYERLSPLGQWF